MSDREDLLNALYASVSETPAWVSFARTARARLRCDQVAVILESEDRDLPIGAYADDTCVEDIDAVAATSPPNAWSMPPAVVAAPFGNALILAVQDDRGRAARLVVWQTGNLTTFPEEQVRLVASLTEPLRRSLSIYSRVVELARRANVNEIALETSRTGVAVLGIDGDLLMHNQVMDQLLAIGDGLRLSGGRLAANRTDDTRALYVEVRRCALSQAADDNTGLYVPMAFPRERRLLPLTAIVRPGAGYHPLPRPLRRTAILVVRDPAMQAQWTASSLASLFGFSRAEALLAAALATGASLDEAAERLAVSRNTVKTQLQGLFLKTGTNRQSDLLRALLNSAASII